MYSAGTASKLQMTLDTNQSSMCFKFLGESMKKMQLKKYSFVRSGKGQRALSESPVLSPWGADGRVK